MISASRSPFDRIDAVRHARFGIRWSAHEEELLLALYPLAPWSDLRAALPRRSKRAIERRAAELRIARHHSRKPVWTDAELETLAKLYGIASWNDLCDALPGRTRAAIGIKGPQLELRRPPEARLQSRYALIRQLRAVRRERRISAWLLADLIGCSKQLIYLWEGEISLPRLPMLLDWVQALDLRLRLEVKQ